MAPKANAGRGDKKKCARARPRSRRGAAIVPAANRVGRARTAASSPAPPRAARPGADDLRSPGLRVLLRPRSARRAQEVAEQVGQGGPHLSGRAHWPRPPLHAPRQAPRRGRPRLPDGGARVHGGRGARARGQRVPRQQEEADHAAPPRPRHPQRRGAQQAPRRRHHRAGRRAAKHPPGARRVRALSAPPPAAHAAALPRARRCSCPSTRRLSRTRPARTSRPPARQPGEPRPPPSASTSLRDWRGAARSAPTTLGVYLHPSTASRIGRGPLSSAPRARAAALFRSCSAFALALGLNPKASLTGRRTRHDPVPRSSDRVSESSFRQARLAPSGYE